MDTDTKYRSYENKIIITNASLHNSLAGLQVPRQNRLTAFYGQTSGIKTNATSSHELHLQIRPRA